MILILGILWYIVGIISYMMVCYSYFKQIYVSDVVLSIYMGLAGPLYLATMLRLSKHDCKLYPRHVGYTKGLK